MSLDKEPHLNVKGIPKMVKCQTVQQAHEGGKMGWNVPKSVVDFFEDIRKPLIRSSPVECIDLCPRRFLYEYRLGIKPRRYESALSMGTIVHKILEALFLGKEPDEALTVCERLLSKEQAKLIEDAGPDGFLPTGESLTAVLKKVEEDYHKARAIGLVFWKFVPFAKDQYEVMRTPDGTPMIELLLEAEYPGLSRPIRVPCDLVLRNKETGGAWIIDYKTTSLQPKDRAATTKMSVAMPIYRLVLQSHFDAWHEAGQADKVKVEGSLHAIIFKPGIKCCGKDEKQAKKDNITSFEAYIERLVQWYKDKEAAEPGNPPLLLDPNRFDRPLMTAELFGRLKQYCKACQASPNIDSFYRVGGGACNQYGKICPYLPLCSSSPVMWPDLIEQRYQIGFREDEENANDS